MEKRFVTFLLISLVTLVAYQYLMVALFGPPQKKPPAVVQPGDGKADPAVPGANPPEMASEPAKQGPLDEGAIANQQPGAPAAGGDQPQDIDAPDPDKAADQPRLVEDNVPVQFTTLGSLDPDGPYQMLVVLRNDGAAIHSVELSSPRYRSLDQSRGYLGELALRETAEGCLVQVVGEGSPADKAGLRGPIFEFQDGKTVQTRAGDVITKVNDSVVKIPSDVEEALSDTRRKQKIEIQILRDGKPQSLSVTLGPTPLRLLNVEGQDSLSQPAQSASFLTTLCQLGSAETRFGDEEIKGLPSLHRRHWTVRQLAATKDTGPGVEFSTTLSAAELEPIGGQGPIRFVKRFLLSSSQTDGDRNHAEGYQLTLDLEWTNESGVAQQLAYQIDGPTGINTEGWWYLYKSHPRRFSAAGARDVVWREADGQHELFPCGEITSNAKDKTDNPQVPLVDSDKRIRMRYVGCDTQYFAAIMMPAPSNPLATKNDKGKDHYVSTDEFARAAAMAVGPLDDRLKRTNVTYRLRSRVFTLDSGSKLSRSYDLFLGPKYEPVLTRFGLSDLVVYGWFGWVSRPMLKLLHGLYWITGSVSYGLSIILLTVLVRGCMYPFGRQMAKNAQKMQELAPEMKKIADLYKNDMEKRAAAQKELFLKHKYNPFSGCIVMFLQMPIFLGLYRGLSCDIELRQAPLVRGLSWCSNLAGPDMFWHWENVVPPFISDTKGFLGLGPYLNLLPLIAVALFLVQQKMFTPPPTDEQQKMQHQIMKFMMVFMGLVFHKVAAGLCLYIITSTVWGIGEKLMLPKSPTPAGGSAAVPVTANVSGNGSSAAQRKKNRRR